jgi:hypothetical protein
MNDLAVSTSSSEGPIHFLNLEYWFNLLYRLGAGGHLDTAGLAALFTRIWSWVTAVGFLVAILAIGVITYVVIELYKLREREKTLFGPLPKIAEDDSAQHVRWKHIETLMASANPSDWRQAIIEADIYLGDILSREGYPGDTIGEKLKAIESSDLDTLDDAWEAHKVRNEIAHQGSSFQLSESLARRTIQRYENVFRELHGL